MRELRRAAHTVYSLHYHFVFTTKHRKPVLVGEVGQTVRDLIREICRSEDIEILQGHVRPDHIHLLPDSARLFSRLQSTQNPSPSGEGRSMRHGVQQHIDSQRVTLD